jgi:hypothetical protein
MTETPTRQPRKRTTKATTAKAEPDTTKGEPEAPPPEPPAEPGITPPQMRLMHVLLRDVLGLLGRDDVLDYLTVLLARPVASRKDITEAEAGLVIDHLSDPNAPKPKGPSIIEVIGDVKRNMRAVGKTQQNVDQGYSFRGISDVMDALAPLLARHGIVYVPHVEDVTITERPTRSGGTQIMAVCRTAWVIYGPSGDYIEAVTYGQGLDTSDKSVNKAATAAEKYMLTQVFAIAFRDEEADRWSPQAEPLPGRDAQPGRDGMPTTPELLAMLDGYAAQLSIDRDAITAKWRHENGDLPLEALDSLDATRLFPLVRNVRAWMAAQPGGTPEATP